MTILVLRPEPGASATVTRARALGLSAVAAPLFRVSPVDWVMPATMPDAVLLTSANAARLSGPGLRVLAHLPLYAVGEATAAAARAVGFVGVVAGTEDVDAIAMRAAADGHRHLLHLCGRDRRAPADAGIAIQPCIVYRSDPAGDLPPLAAGTVALLHSARAAARFTALVVDRGAVAVAAISPPALAAAGTGWRATAVAAQPTDAALLAAAAGLCQG